VGILVFFLGFAQLDLIDFDAVVWVSEGVVECKVVGVGDVSAGGEFS
jgi:hypothetical protein